MHTEKTTMSNTTINKTIFYTASREVVWAFLTEKEKLAKWFHPANNDLVEGQDYALVDKDSGQKLCWGNVLEMDKPSKLVYTFTIIPLDGAMTTVTWTLDEIAGGTRLSLKHEGISEAAGEAAMGLLLALDKGWDDHLNSMRAVLNTEEDNDCHD